ncbi:response regulator transcription factor [Achromobacter sp.]|uniref:response regulator transcription factor n=1 Tax=Achromobacter sp. TaxID=134375 RepID=UPI003C74B35E
MLNSAELSPGEYDVLRSLAAGANVMEIAAQLRKSPKTISTQKAAAFRKLGVTTNNGLYRLVGKTVDSAQRAGARAKSRSGLGQC